MIAHKFQPGMPYKLGLGLGVTAILGVCLYVAIKQIRQYQATLPRADADYYLQIGNLKRAYDLHIPPSYTGKKTVPLMIALHGVGGNGSGMPGQTGFNALADQRGFIVAYPDAVNGHWNARRGGKPDTTNDVGFISTLIDDLQKRYKIDPSQVYVSGFSNGGTFAHRLGCELSDKISGIAAVAAPIPEYIATTCKPTKPLSIVLFHGTKDEAFPFETSGRAVLSVPETFKHWGSQVGCSQKVVTKTLPTISGVKVLTYSQCPGQAKVALYQVEGGGHDWVGIHPDVANGSKTAAQFSPSEIMWDFFSQK